MKFVSVSSLQPGMVLGRDIVSPSQSFMLKRGVTLNEEYIEYLDKKGYLGAYITDKDNLDIEPEEPIDIKTLSQSVSAVKESNVGELLNSAKQIVADISTSATTSRRCATLVPLTVRSPASSFSKGV